MQLLGCNKGKALRQIKPHLMAEYAQRPRARPVLLLNPMVENMLHERVIGVHYALLMARLGAGAIENRLASPFSSKV